MQEAGHVILSPIWSGFLFVCPHCTVPGLNNAGSIPGGHTGQVFPPVVRSKIKSWVNPVTFSSFF